MAAAVALVAGGGAALVFNESPDPGPDPEVARQQQIEEFAEQDARDILTAGHEAMGELDAMHVEARFRSEDDARRSVNVALSRSGDCTGELDYGQGNGTVEFLRTEDRSLVRPDNEFWSTTSDNPSTIIDEVDGRWVENDGLAETFETFCDMDEFIGYFEPGAKTEYTNRGLSKVDSHDIVTVREGDDQSSEIYVNADEPHHVIRLQDDEEGYFEFKDFDVEPEVELPSASDIYKLDS